MKIAEVVASFFPIIFLCAMPSQELSAYESRIFSQFISFEAEERKHSTNIWFRIQAAYLLIDFSCLQHSVDIRRYNLPQAYLLS